MNILNALKSYATTAVETLAEVAVGILTGPIGCAAPAPAHPVNRPLVRPDECVAESELCQKVQQDVMVLGNDRFKAGQLGRQCDVYCPPDQQDSIFCRCLATTSIGGERDYDRCIASANEALEKEQKPDQTCR